MVGWSVKTDASVATSMVFELLISNYRGYTSVETSDEAVRKLVLSVKVSESVIEEGRPDLPDFSMLAYMPRLKADVSPNIQHQENCIDIA